MIIYNIRANGPYEYDKFVLNIFQLITDVRACEQELENSDILTGTNKSEIALLNAYDTIVEESNRVQTLARTLLY